MHSNVFLTNISTAFCFFEIQMGLIFWGLRELQKGLKLCFLAQKRVISFEEVNSTAVIKGDPISYFFLLFLHQQYILSKDINLNITFPLMEEQNS